MFSDDIFELLPAAIREAEKLGLSPVLVVAARCEDSHRSAQVVLDGNGTEIETIQAIGVLLQRIAEVRKEREQKICEAKRDFHDAVNAIGKLEKHSSLQHLLGRHTRSLEDAFHQFRMTYGC